MKFILTRTSNRENKPIKQAIKIKIPYWHYRTCSEIYFDKHFSDSEGLWKSKGKNHKEFKGSGGLESRHICRQEEDREVWGIEVLDLEDLLKIISKNGEIVISEYCDNGPDNKNPIFKIEIYDDYRE